MYLWHHWLPLIRRVPPSVVVVAGVGEGVCVCGGGGGGGWGGGGYGEGLADAFRIETLEWRQD